MYEGAVHCLLITLSYWLSTNECVNVQNTPKRKAPKSLAHHYIYVKESAKEHLSMCSVGQCSAVVYSAPGYSVVHYTVHWKVVQCSSI